jgi:hypothetical protein
MKGDAVCIVCNGCVSLSKEHSMKKDYEPKHAITTAIQRQLRVKMTQNSKPSCSTEKLIQTDAAVRANYVVSKILVIRMKPFSDGETTNA